MMHKRQTAEKDILYIFLHIPKCAGSTFRYHVEHNLKKGEFVSLYEGEYFDVNEMAYKYFTPGKRREEIDAYLDSLSDVQKDTIRIIYGHQVYYGIHRFFPGREVRYITFVRHHAAREVSMYNFYREHVEDPSRRFLKKENVYQANDVSEIRKDLIRDGRILSFSEWLQERTWHSNFITRFLILRGFAEPGAFPEDMFKRFYFVGITENYHSDALFLYYLLGVKKFYPDKNISKKYFLPKDLSEELCGLMSERNTRDATLYDCAIRLHKTFKVKEPRFESIVGYMKLKVFYSRRSIPFWIAYDRASSALRRRAPLFVQFLGDMGNIVSSFKNRKIKF